MTDFDLGEFEDCDAAIAALAQKVDGQCEALALLAGLFLAELSSRREDPRGAIDQLTDMLDQYVDQLNSFTKRHAQKGVLAVQERVRDVARMSLPVFQ